MSKGNVNPDFDVAHPDWVREGQNKNFIQLTKMIKEDVKRYQDKAMERRIKIGSER